jgi:hypothetical protein
MSCPFLRSCIVDFLNVFELLNDISGLLCISLIILMMKCDIAMILVTNELMEGVVFDVQDHARRTGTTWTGTHGEMISSDLHGAEEPIRWLLRPRQRGRDRTVFDRGFAPEKKRTFD